MSVNFSPYQPPPDVPPTDPPESSSSLLGKGKAKRPWFTRCYLLSTVSDSADLSDPSSYGNSYQAGGSLSDPTAVPAAYTNDPEAAAYASGSGSGATDERVNVWESRLGFRIDIMAAAAYLGGPVTALFFLVLETQNDYVRFHAYQSALLTTPILIVLLLSNLLIPLPSFIRSLLILGGVGGTFYAAYRAWRDAQDGLGRFWLPYIGELAERWVGEE